MSDPRVTTRQTINVALNDLDQSKITQGSRTIITGKGGVGKTTVTALLAQFFVSQNRNVLAVDADSQINLPYALGYPVEKCSSIVPLNQNLAYIEEKIGVKSEINWGAFLKLNPSVEDVVERFGIKINDQLSCLVMGTVTQSSGGCLCLENTLLSAIIRQLSLQPNDLVLLDTQAGVEHFGRSLAKDFTQCLILSDGTFNSISVAVHLAELASSLGIHRNYLLLNFVDDLAKCHALRWLKHFDKKANCFAEIFTLPTEEKLLEFEPNVSAFYNQYPDSPLITSIKAIGTTLQK